MAQNGTAMSTDACTRLVVAECILANIHHTPLVVAVAAQPMVALLPCRCPHAQLWPHIVFLPV